MINIKKEKLEKILLPLLVVLGTMATVTFILLSMFGTIIYFENIIAYQIVSISGIIVLISYMPLMIHISEFEYLREVEFSTRLSKISITLFSTGLLIIFFTMLSLAINRFLF